MNLVNIFLILLLIFATPISGITSEKITLQLRWDHNFQFAGYYAAKWEGYYDEKGLDVEVKTAIKKNGSILSSIKEVSEEHADFGIGSADILIANDKTKNIFILASIFQQSPVEFYSLKSVKLRTPADLINLKVSRRKKDLVDIEFQAMVTAEGINPKKIKDFPFDQTKGYLAELLAGNIDVIPGYKIGTPHEAKKLGIELNRLRPIDYGVDFYGDSLFTNEKMLRYNSKVVEAFLEASLKGWEYALNNPEKIANRIIKEFKPRFPIVDFPDFIRFQINPVKSLTMHEIIKVGNTNSARWERMHGTLKGLGYIHNTFTPEIIYDPTKAHQRIIEKRVRLAYIVSIAFGILLFISFLWVMALRATVRRQTKKIRESEMRYKTIYQNAQVGLGKTKISDGKIFECNQKMADIFGYKTPDEFVAEGVLSERYVDKDKRKKFLYALHQQGFIRNQEARFYRKDGQIVWARFDSQIFPDQGYMEDVVIDITKQKESEMKSLRQQKAITLNNSIANVFLTSSGNDIFADTLDVILETLESPFGYFGYIDEDGNLNCPSMTRNIWKKCDIPDKSIVFPKEIWGGVWGESLKNAKTVISTEGLKLPEGHIQLECAMAVPIIHHDEVIGQFVIADKESGYGKYEKFLLESAASQTAPILNNLLEKETQEKEYKKMQARIEQAQKMESVGNMAGGIAHDFNNLLFPIVGLSEMMLDDFPPESLERQNIQEIFNAGTRGRELVQQILSFSRQSEYQPIPVHIQKILKEVLKLCRSTIPADIKITKDIQIDCRQVMADPTKIHQIAMNLITNAYHAVEPSGGTITVELREIDYRHRGDPAVQLASGRYAVLSVSDNGTGINPAVMNKIFDPYFTTKEKGRGTGLGLATVYGIVKAHGGDIMVTSELGKGAAFHVYLPLSEKEQDSETENKMTPLPTGTGHILLVDDEKAIVHLEKQMLERLGYQTSSFTGSREALTTFKSDPSRFDLVITDMNMPNMNGMKLAAELIAIRPDIPIILCTGFSERIDNNKAENLGTRGLLMKPVGMKDLAQKIREVLDTTTKSS